MKWQTRVSDGQGMVRGKDVKKLVGTITFTDMIFLTMTGKLPKDNERRMLDAMFVAATEHSVAVPSISAARIVASAGNTMNVGVAAGVLAIGEHHGGAIEKCAMILQETENVEARIDAMLLRKERMPGYGHKTYKRDPRAVQLIDLAQKEKISGKHVKLAQEFDHLLWKKTEKELHLNIDGAMAAILSDLGVPWQMARAFFIIPRTVGICAHVHEEMVFEKPYRRFEDNEVQYVEEE